MDQQRLFGIIFYLKGDEFSDCGHVVSGTRCHHGRKVEGLQIGTGRVPVSYTHLDVYKRQDQEGTVDAGGGVMLHRAVQGGELPGLPEEAHGGAVRALSLIHI